MQRNFSDWRARRRHSRSARNSGDRGARTQSSTSGPSMTTASTTGPLEPPPTRKQRNPMSEILTSTIDSPIGPLTLIARDGVLTNLSMLEHRHTPPPPDDAITDDAWFMDVAAQLEAYFAGELTAFDLEMDLRGTAFQQQVWSQLLAIPYGETISYGELATRIGNPNG